MGRRERWRKDTEAPRMTAPAAGLAPFGVADQGVGDRLFVQGQGVGAVTARKMLPAPHGPIEYIEVTSSQGRVFVPTHLPSTSVRPLMTAARAHQILQRLGRRDAVVDPRPWEQRHADWQAALTRADPEAMAEALLGLHASPGPRSFGERKLAEILEEQLYGELAVVLGLTVDEVRGRGVSVAASA